jgi:hypothetical protein
MDRQVEAAVLPTRLAPYTIGKQIYGFMTVSEDYRAPLAQIA